MNLVSIISIWEYKTITCARTSWQHGTFKSTDLKLSNVKHNSFPYFSAERPPGECSFPLQDCSVPFLVLLYFLALARFSYCTLSNNSAKRDSEVGICCCFMKEEGKVGRLKRPRSKLREEAKASC